ncbi:MAG: hypothetical protein DYG89_06030 [Caldilinea sp. CFX5]|nr:hypothetical protein [Caldilinea sp. CFX5]
MKIFCGKQTYDELGQESAHEGLQYKFYYVRARETGQRFTLITTDENFLAGSGNQRVLQRAGRILSTVDSAHIVKAHDIGQQEGLLFLVLEDVQGNLLPQWVKNRQSGEPLDEYTALSFFRQLAIALKDMERVNVAHGCLHPTSMYIYPDPLARGGEIVKIWDLALSSASNQDFHFQAPEMLSADAKAEGEIRDIRTDIYSVGAIIYWLLTGKPPLEANNRGQLALRIISQHEKDKPPSLAYVRQDLSKHCVELIMRCLEKQPAQRFASATELISKIETVLGKKQNAVDHLLHLVVQADKQGDWEEIIRLGRRAADHPGVLKQMQGSLQKAKKMLEESDLNRINDLIEKATACLTKNQLTEAAAYLEDGKRLLNSNQDIRQKQKTEQLFKLRELENRLNEQKRFKPAYLQSKHTQKNYQLDLKQMRVGRGMSSTTQPGFINLADEPEELARSVSREEQAVFFFEEGQWKLMHSDKARNRTYLNQTNLNANQKYVVDDQATITFGRVEFEFHFGSA